MSFKDKIKCEFKKLPCSDANIVCNKKKYYILHRFSYYKVLFTNVQYPCTTSQVFECEIN